ncbi:hypothetical protein GLOIN_2v1769038 [Rhizophagus clarus]|uniref:SAM domain-containing protein n=1 Tax=Rhizophagus clarus TaxID=94130 RepID=A0A8H3MCV9_9GLOM|nr:hypothetical protein GLOIN_2v1769038 [Rhizophagus clarus]
MSNMVQYKIGTFPYTFGRTFDNSLNLNKKVYIQNQTIFYSYNVDLKKKFSFTLCSTCNSSFQRLSKTKNTSSSSQKTISSPQKTTSSSHNIFSQDKNIITIDDDFTNSTTTDLTDKSINFKNENCEENEEILKEISFTFIIKKADERSLPRKWLTFDALTFEEFIVQIQRYVESMIGIDDIDQTEYFLAFKPVKSNGEGLELSESKDFEKFLNEYERLLKAKKEIAVIAKMKVMKQKAEKETEANKGLTSHQKTIGKLVMELCEQWHYSQDNLPCYVALKIYLKLTAKLLAMWAECIVEGTATIEIAPNYSEFAVQHATKKNSSSATLISSQVFPTYPVQYIPSLPLNIVIKEFLEKVDKDKGSNGEFIQFIDAFNKQKLSVKHIKDLSDDKFQILGVTTIGWHKTIQVAIKQYK